MTEFKSDDDILDAQERFIEEHLGKKAADGANYGWAVDEVEGTYCTKVYGHGVVTTDMRTLGHHFSPFD